jgi:hypothetical protein
MFGTRRISLELSVRASGSRTFFAMLHILFNFAILLCSKLLLFGTAASERAGRGRYLVVPSSFVRRIVDIAVYAIDVRLKKPGVQLQLMRNLLLFFAPLTANFIRSKLSVHI